ncbi:hypothetical protein WG66_007384 [Moniliophthora roreri]|nr:hypothetical protein WG66_007384 [Moniliophthora roreri]
MSGMMARRTGWKSRAAFGIYQLPEELIGMIFYFCGCIGNGNTLLYPCSLVNRYWLALSRRQFFKGRLTFTATRNISTIPRFIAAMKNPIVPITIPFYDISTLTLKFRWPSPPQGADFWYSLDHIGLACRLLEQLDGPANPNTLILHFVFPMLDSNELLFGFKNTFPRINHLHLELDREYLNPLLRFICSFPELQTLEVVCKELDTNGVQAYTYRLPESVHTLHLCITNFLRNTHILFLYWLSDQPRMKEIHSLSLTDPDRLSICSNGMIPRCLQLCKKIRSLYLIFPHIADGMVPVDDRKGYMIGHLRGLQCITFHISGGKEEGQGATDSERDAISGVLNRVGHTLETVSSINLELVTFVVDGVVASDAWDGLDVVLSFRKFDAVRKWITVLTTQEIAINTYRKLLPRCEKQGSLSVTRLCKEGSRDVNMLETRLI